MKKREHPCRVKSERRRWLHLAGASLVCSVFPWSKGFAAEKQPTILAVRVWPASDYTRVTLEYDQPVKFSHFLIENPDRLVVDIEGIEFNKVLESLTGKVGADDPYIKLLRAGRFKPGVVRLVMDLKTQIAPQVFTLKPIGDYGHRLVLDVYPRNPVDPLLALLENREGRGKGTENESVVATGNTAPSIQTTRKSAVIDRLVIVALDPGHGGEDPGAVGKRGTFEKTVTLAIASRLRKRIDEEPNMRAFLTRDSDFFVPLGQRVQKARKMRADLFVSIHADAWIKPDARGSSVFVLSEGGASSSAAKWLAQKENSADMVGGVNIGTRDPVLAKTLLDLSQTATINDSIKLARNLLGELGTINTLHKARVEQASFAVLKAPDIPSVLIETAFISNPEEEIRLTDEHYQSKMADAILKGIRGYFLKNPPHPHNRLV